MNELARENARPEATDGASRLDTFLLLNMHETWRSLEEDVPTIERFSGPNSVAPLLRNAIAQLEHSLELHPLTVHEWNAVAGPASLLVCRFLKLISLNTDAISTAEGVETVTKIATIFLPPCRDAENLKDAMAKANGLRILNLICWEDFDFLARKKIFTIFRDVLLSKFVKLRRRSLESQVVIDRLVDMFQTCGDYDFQEYITEALIRFSLQRNTGPNEIRLQELKSFFRNSPQIAEATSVINTKALDTAIKDFVIRANESLPLASRVFSLNCLEARANDTELQKPGDFPNMTLDLSPRTGNMQLLFSCASGDLVKINVDDEVLDMIRTNNVHHTAWPAPQTNEIEIKFHLAEPGIRVPFEPKDLHAMSLTFVCQNNEQFAQAEEHFFKRCYLSKYEGRRGFEDVQEVSSTSPDVNSEINRSLFMERCSISHSVHCNPSTIKTGCPSRSSITSGAFCQNPEFLDPVQETSVEPKDTVGLTSDEVMDLTDEHTNVEHGPSSAAVDNDVTPSISKLTDAEHSCDMMLVADQSSNMFIRPSHIVQSLNKIDLDLHRHSSHLLDNSIPENVDNQSKPIYERIFGSDINLPSFETLSQQSDYQHTFVEPLNFKMAPEPRKHPDQFRSNASYSESERSACSSFAPVMFRSTNTLKIRPPSFDPSQVDQSKNVGPNDVYSFVDDETIEPLTGLDRTRRRAALPARCRRMLYTPGRFDLMKDAESAKSDPGLVDIAKKLFTKSSNVYQTPGSSVVVAGGSVEEGTDSREARECSTLESSFLPAKIRTPSSSRGSASTGSNKDSIPNEDNIRSANRDGVSTHATTEQGSSSTDQMPGCSTMVSGSFDTNARLVRKRKSSPPNGSHLPSKRKQSSSSESDNSSRSKMNKPSPPARNTLPRRAKGDGVSAHATDKQGSSNTDQMPGCSTIMIGSIDTNSRLASRRKSSFPNGSHLSSKRKRSSSSGSDDSYMSKTNGPSPPTRNRLPRRTKGDGTLTRGQLKHSGQRMFFSSKLKELRNFPDLPKRKKRGFVQAKGRRPFANVMNSASSSKIDPLRSGVTTSPGVVTEKPEVSSNEIPIPQPPVSPTGDDIEAMAISPPSPVAPVGELVVKTRGRCRARRESPDVTTVRSPKRPNRSQAGRKREVPDSTIAVSTSSGLGSSEGSDTSPVAKKGNEQKKEMRSRLKEMFEPSQEHAAASGSNGSDDSPSYITIRRLNRSQALDKPELPAPEPVSSSLHIFTPDNTAPFEEETVSHHIGQSSHASLEQAHVPENPSPSGQPVCDEPSPSTSYFGSRFHNANPSSTQAQSTPDMLNAPVFPASFQRRSPDRLLSERTRLIHNMTNHAVDVLEVELGRLVADPFEGRYDVLEAMKTNLCGLLANFIAWSNMADHNIRMIEEHSNSVLQLTNQLTNATNSMATSFGVTVEMINAIREVQRESVVTANVRYHDPRTYSRARQHFMRIFDENLPPP